MCRRYFKRMQYSTTLQQKDSLYSILLLLYKKKRREVNETNFVSPVKRTKCFTQLHTQWTICVMKTRRYVNFGLLLREVVNYAIVFAIWIQEYKHPCYQMPVSVAVVQECTLSLFLSACIGTFVCLVYRTIGIGCDALMLAFLYVCVRVSEWVCSACCCYWMNRMTLFLFSLL